jgi:hypothetical protein
VNECTEYLWDRSGPPDADLVALEAALSPLRFRAVPLKLPVLTRAEPPPPVMAAPWRPRRAFATAASVALALIGASLGHRAASGWEVERAAGPGGVPAAQVLTAGRWLDTTGASRLRIAVGEIGHVTVEPGSRVRIRDTRGSRHILELAHGTLDAVIVAPPRLFIVDGPGVRAVDLGCAYTLSLDERGAGMLRVRQGFVELERESLSSIVPRGARCATLAARGPGLPYCDDADPALANLARASDSGGLDDATLERGLAAARSHDALTLWHLLPRIDEVRRGLVISRLAELAEPPPGVTRDAVQKLDPGALRAWWDSLSF